MSNTTRSDTNESPTDNRLLNARFPRSNAYQPKWVIGSASGGANSLWLSEWLCEALDLRPGMRVLDLGCGRAASSIFLHREFGVEVWATDLWCSPSLNLQRIRDAQVQAHVFPIHSDARSLPFAADFFDVIVCIDSYFYFGTDDLYLSYLGQFLKPGGVLGIAGVGLMRELNDTVPEHLSKWWTPELWCLHSADWWRRHWERTGILNIEVADSLTDGWRHWLAWHHVIAPDNHLEIEAVQADAGSYLGYVRAVGRRCENVILEPPVVSIPGEYSRQPLLRNEES